MSGENVNVVLGRDAQGLVRLYKGLSSFEEMKLKPELLKGVYAAGFQQPSKIQEKAIPILLEDPPLNLIAQSQSGTGKTATFSLAALSRVDWTRQTAQCIILAPARELARQISDVINELGKFTPVKVAMGVPKDVNEPRDNSPITEQIVVGTPGTIQSWIRFRRINLQDIKLFILDEADSMLNTQSLGDQAIRIRNSLHQNCQVALFSATFPPNVRDFAEQVAPGATKITLQQQELSVDAIKQFYMDCDNEDHKFDVLVALYGLLTIGQSIIFVNRRDVADRIAEKMTEAGHKVISLHGAFEHGDRDQVIDAFRSGKAKVLITTNVLARGIDILQVNVVINYDMPLDQQGLPDYETYCTFQCHETNPAKVHRIGRTGRFGRQGVSINFVHNRRSRDTMRAMEDYFGKEIVRVPTDSYATIEETLRKATKGL